MLGCVSALVEALRPVPPSEGVDGRGQHTGDVRVRCPVLTHLRVHGGFSGEAKSRDFLDLLYSCMATRAQNGATVRNLDLHLMHRNKTPLSDNHRVFLRNVRIIVPVFTFKFGPSEGCRLCH
ncbi:hypothetical protein BD413DRAFT_582886 [Trametes elegans]|nr:hypothetical protein BD413DRAFT_582886 [Trametes elegans]